MCPPKYRNDTTAVVITSLSIFIIIDTHATITWGKDAKKAEYNAAVIEQIAQMAWITEQINLEAQGLKMHTFNNIITVNMARIVITENNRTIKPEKSIQQPN